MKGRVRMTFDELIDELSADFKVNFSAPVPFYDFDRDDFASYYASILDSVYPGQIESISVMCTGWDGAYKVNVNDIDYYTCMISGFDSKERVKENVEYLSKVITGRTDSSMPKELPVRLVDFPVNEVGICRNYYINKTTEEFYQYIYSNQNLRFRYDLKKSRN